MLKSIDSIHQTNNIYFGFLQRQHKHFGPEGFKPPTCGGPASGYVCCKVGVVSFMFVISFSWFSTFLLSRLKMDWLNLWLTHHHHLQAKLLVDPLPMWTMLEICSVVTQDPPGPKMSSKSATLANVAREMLKAWLEEWQTLTLEREILTLVSNQMTGN